MTQGKVKAAKVKVYEPPAGTAGAGGQFHVYVYDAFHKTFAAAKSFETVEKATAFQRHEQERIYTVQEAEPELFDLPFISSDSDLMARIEREPAYRQRLERDLGADARARGRRH
ncbi:MAG: hypothetical protein HY076_09235 [Candidatus Eisenbacteria bacterium]|uniref:Uncharacterized protein n=1 Tax=Eiseniibacteriota bacterium TaxID=2212470 RepID=A0A9D6QKR1_UNCEI|nr:hypothetical protein [Candidatus Eisenbacteria bacterium]MBI3540441.1 hypothetical protein [Candidatus Eisenbacteria bacterium]